ncbi:MAG: hypothetical protein ACXVH7_00920 [Thermoanaerobaculia bacterium]
MLRPLAASVAGRRVYIIDLSVSGFSVVHQDSIGRIGEEPLLTFEWEGKKITVRCAIARTGVERAGTATQPTLYQSGLDIADLADEGRNALRELVHNHVERALDEQKANAKGIPPLAVQYEQSGNATEFVRHELVAGKWRYFRTRDKEQPANGFTIAADHPENEVEMLREAYAKGDRSMREIIRQTAELSIKSPDGIPIRRYTP